MLFLGSSVLCLFAFFSRPCAACAGEEGKELNISCGLPADRAKNGLFWRVKAGDVNKRIAACLDSQFCSNMEPDNFVATLSGSTTSTVSTLTIKNVSRTVPFNMENSTWICEWVKDDYNYTCCSSLQVYVKPEKPVCEPPKLNTSNFMIEVKCTTLKVYPQVTCLIYLGYDNESFNYNIGNFQGEDLPIGDPVMYYKSECILSVRLTDIENGGNFFQVGMCPRTYCAYVYSDIYRINLAIVNEEPNTNEETDYSLPIMITLGVLLAVSVGVVIALAVVVGRFRKQQREPKLHPQLSKKTTDDGTSPRGYDGIYTPGQRSSDDVYEYIDSSNNVLGSSTISARESRYVNAPDPEPAEDYVN